MAGLSPIMLVGSHLSERSHGRKTSARQLAAYREHKARIEHDAREALEAERAERRDQFPGSGHGAVDRVRAAAPAVGAAPYRPGLPAAPGRDGRPAVERSS